MSTLAHPFILRDLALAGERGIKLDSLTAFQQQLELCRQWGFQIKEAEGRICLRFDQEQLIPLWIQRETPAIAWEQTNVVGFLSVPSTNTEAMNLARIGAPQGTLVYAEQQTAGKGRRNRTWFSPAGAGLYFSLVLRPQQSRDKWQLLAHTASIALVKTLSSLSNWKAQIPLRRIELKWPNDVLLSGKKCAGILLEAGCIESENAAAVVGVGINVHAVSFPNSMGVEATCIDEIAQTTVPRRKLLVDFLCQFQEWYLIFEQGEHSRLLQEWEYYCPMSKDTKVWISNGIGRRSGITCGVTQDGALLVRMDNGELETIFAGDVSIRKVNAGNG